MKRGAQPHRMPAKKKTTRKTPAKKRQAQTSGSKKPRSPPRKKRAPAKRTKTQEADPAPEPGLAKMGRPKIELTPEAVEALARIGVTHRTMALALRVSERTIERRFAEDPEFQAAIERGRADREVVLRRYLYTYAVDTNRTVRASAVRALGMLLAEFGVGERSVVEHEGVPGLVIMIPSNDRVPVDGLRQVEVETVARDLPPLELVAGDDEGQNP